MIEVRCRGTLRTSVNGERGGTLRTVLDWNLMIKVILTVCFLLVDYNILIPVGS